MNDRLDYAIASVLIRVPPVSVLDDRGNRPITDR